jgi:hypothetical protein
MKFCLLTLIASAAGQDLFLAKQGAAKTDLVRAELKSQPGRLAGRSARDIADKINSHMKKAGIDTKECDEHTLEELNDIVRGIFKQGVSSDLEQIYQRNGDGRSRRFSTLEEYETVWAEEMHSETLHHAKCFEIVELWAHHMTDADKSTFDGALPTVPVYDGSKAEDKTYAEATSCQTGHKMVKGGDGTSSHEWPDWPEQLHYKAKAHGAYPFWWGGGSDSGTADMEVYWSEKDGAEKFIHSSCTGQTSSFKGACTHMYFADGPVGYLWLNDESKCCLTEPGKSANATGLYGPGPGGSETLAPSQGNFWNTFTYKGEVDFNGVYYKGKAKYYVLTGVNEPVREFWYFTDLDGKPVQQGEAGTGPTDQGYPVSIGHTIWHDYDPSSLDSSAFDSSVFDIPSVCKKTTTSCAFP